MKFWLLALIALPFAAALIIGKFAIPALRRLKVGQTERTDAVESHIKKGGTPTMGGIIFLCPVLLGTLILGLITMEPSYFVLFGVTFCFGLVGFLDDFLKVKKHNKDGLLPYQKMGALFVVSALAACYLSFGTIGKNFVSFSFFGAYAVVDFGVFFIPFAIFMMLAMTNSTNLTDGLDGLLGGTSVFVFMFIAGASVIFTEGLTGIKENPVFAFSLLFLGSLFAFLIFNTHPAKIFMGDTGSLAIGGAMAMCMLILRHPFAIAAAGLLFVLEALSDILQVSYFKITKKIYGEGKRILKCAPLHHHFEKCGLPETAVTSLFWLFTAAMCFITYLAIL